tara:strand:- start:35379 stop:36107 length:729 start_codon:yes stop_codon:yes gene_type:complete
LAAENSIDCGCLLALFIFSLHFGGCRSVWQEGHNFYSRGTKNADFSTVTAATVYHCFTSLGTECHFKIRSIKMGLFTSKEFSNLEDLFVEQIQDLYDAENRLVDALPKMAEAASCQELKSAFQTHLGETKEHVKRLESVFKGMGVEPKRESCEAMKGLISEGEEMVKAKGDSNVKDAALIAAAQRVEHYEMAGYGSARNFAQRLGKTNLAEILQETLDEEGNADKILTQIAEESTNKAAARA